MTRHRFRLERAADWPTSLHATADRYEAAVHATSVFGSEAHFDATNAELKAAAREYRREMLALDRKRRPEVHETGHAEPTND